ncbi:MAG: hypothetical protein PHC28_10670 [Flavobacterium sp.]|uniref:hypothetical protein n=1 Tax=Flavobacterium sp. TaxID=239 RepID=UPI002606B19B|nr:hypothetical protein [Flavobacterium sp.]MDD5150921.1 hypothetical protein [Flavobacterium sp.]
MKSVSKIYSKISWFSFFFLFVFIATAQVGIGTTTPLSTFEVNGSVGQKVNTITATTTLDDTYGIVICNNGSTAITVTLPNVALCTGRVYTIKRNATSTANVTIAGTIDGATNLVMSKAGEAVTLFSNGTEWKAASTNNSSLSSDWNLTGNAGTTPGTDFVGTTDAQDLVLKTNATSRINVTSAGVTTIGDIAGGNDTKIEGDGTLVFEGNAEVWDDLRVSLDKGSNSASLQYVWGSTGPQIWYFRNNEGLEMMSFVVQIPHSWKEGTVIYPHIHWIPNASRTGNVEWNLDYSWQNYDATTPQVFPTFTTSTVVTTGPFVANTHRITSLTGGSGLDGTGKKISSVLICRIWRNSSNSADTYGDDAGLLSLDFHYQIDTVGSREQYVK